MTSEHNVHQEGCLICATDAVDDAAVIFRDEFWAAEVVSGYDVPGWVILRARRHAERITGLNDEELGTFGYRTRDLVAAVSEVMDAPATYLLVFGENYPHFHVLVTPRADDVPGDRRGGDILKLRNEAADPVTALKLVPALSLSYGQAVQKRAAASRHVS